MKNFDAVHCKRLNRDFHRNGIETGAATTVVYSNDDNGVSRHATTGNRILNRILNDAVLNDIDVASYIRNDVLASRQSIVSRYEVHRVNRSCDNGIYSIIDNNREFNRSLQRTAVGVNNLVNTHRIGSITIIEEGEVKCIGRLVCIIARSIGGKGSNASPIDIIVGSGTTGNSRHNLVIKVGGTEHEAVSDGGVIIEGCPLDTRTSVNGEQYLDCIGGGVAAKVMNRKNDDGVNGHRIAGGRHLDGIKDTAVIIRSNGASKVGDDVLTTSIGQCGIHCVNRPGNGGSDGVLDKESKLN